MDAAKALQLLQQIHSFGQTDLREACEVEIARDFENCVQLSSFTKLSSSQLARILARDDLWVTQEEVVVQGLFNWMKTSKKRRSHLGMLLQLIDLPSLSTQNLKRLRSFAQSMGEDGFELQYSADEALRSQLKAKAQWTEGFHRPPGKRRCLQHWSTEQRSFSRSYIRGRWVAGDWGTRFGSNLVPVGVREWKMSNGSNGRNRRKSRSPGNSSLRSQPNQLYLKDFWWFLQYSSTSCKRCSNLPLHILTLLSYGPGLCSLPRDTFVEILQIFDFWRPFLAKDPGLGFLITLRLEKGVAMAKLVQEHPTEYPKHRVCVKIHNLKGC